MNRRRPSFMLAAVAALAAVSVPTRAVDPATGDRATYESLQQIGKKKKHNRHKPIDHTPRGRFGTWVKFKVWKNIRNKNGEIANCCFSERPHCAKHMTRYKHLRYLATLEDETSGLRHAIHAKAFGCPKCLHAA